MNVRFWLGLFYLSALTGCADNGPSFFNHMNLHSASANQLKDRVEEQQEKARQGQVPRQMQDPYAYRDSRA